MSIYDELEILLEKLEKTRPSKGGRKPVEIGEARDFTVQDAGGRVYIELPVHTLGAVGGGKVSAFFQDSAIVAVKV